MLEELFSKLIVEWGQLVTNTKDLISYLESKYSKGSDAETKAARECLSNMRFLVTAMDQQMQGANSDTNAGVRDVATKVQNYLETTEPLHQDLTQRSQGDTKTEECASSVQNARGTVGEQVKAIHEATSVHAMSLTPPGGGLVPEGLKTSGMVPTGASAVDGQAETAPTPALPLIISLLKANGLDDKDPIVIATSALLAGHTPRPALQDQAIGLLIDEWRKAVDTFTTKLTAPGTSRQLASIVGLIELHAELEVLYDQLINIEEGARVSVTSLLSIR